MNLVMRVGATMSGIFLFGGAGSMWLGPATAEHMIPTAVISTLGLLGGLSVFSAGWRMKEPQPEQSPQT